MIKRLGLLLAVTWLLAGCATPKSAAPLRLGPHPWQAGERTFYDVLGRDGQRLGEATWNWIQDGDEWIQVYELVVSGNVTTGEVRTGEDLLPIGSWRESGGRRVEATYADDKVTIVTTAPDGKTTTREVTRKADTLDNDQSLQTQRALPLAADYVTTYSNVVPTTGAEVRMTITVAGREQVTVPAGTFAAWRVEMRVGQATHEAWYGVEPPHLLLRYVNRASGVEFRLRAWQESEGAPLQGSAEAEPADLDESVVGRSPRSTGLMCSFPFSCNTR